MKRFLLFPLALCLVAFSASAQSAAEIAAAQSLARSYGYTNEEINAVLNHDIYGRTSGPAGQQKVVPATIPNQARPGVMVLGEEVPIEVAPVDSAVHHSPIFGHDFFISKGLSLIPSITAPVPASYVLGPGDQVLVSVWGSANADKDYTIESDGAIRIESVGPVHLAGLTVEAAQKQLQNRLSAIYGGLRNGTASLQVTVGKIRGISVYVLGGVKIPGVYTLPSLASVPTALYMAGGVLQSASVRNIHIYRGGKEMGVFDLYSFIFSGETLSSLMLQDGDIVSVGQQENIVSIDGEVARTMRFEMRSDETLEHLIRYASGFTAKARRDRVHVDRQTEAVGTSFDVASDAFSSFVLAAGDSVFVNSLLSKYDNRVLISGSVKHPGPYALSPSLKTLRDLIEAAGGVQEGTHLSRGFIVRNDESMRPVSVSFDLGAVLDGRTDIDLVRDDSVRVFSVMELEDKKQVSIYGNVANPGEFDFRDGMTLGDLILASGGLKYASDLSNVEIAVQGLEGPASTRQLDLQADSTLNDTPLSPFDKVYVRPLQYFRPIKSIEVRGEVRYPGFYAAESNSVRLSDIISRCGGFTDDAFIKGAKLRRRMSDFEIERSNLAQEIAERQRYSAKDSTKDDEMMVANGKALRIKKKSSEQTDSDAQQEETYYEEIIYPTYYVAIDIESAMKKPYSDSDLILCDGDVLEIPQMNNTVKISGGVYMPNTVTYNPSYGWRDYVNMAGGFVKGARTRKTYAVYQDGSSAVRGSSKFHMEPGMEIVVPVDTVRSSRITLAEAVSVTSAASSIVYVIAILLNMFKQ